MKDHFQEVDENLEDPSLLVEGSQQFPCPSCGATMIFSPEHQSLRCQYCETTADLASEDTTVIEYPLNEAEEKADHNWGGEKVVLKCSQCGGESVVDNSTKSSTCVFCGSSHVVIEDKDLGIKPESLVPFHITKDDAEKKFVQWIKKRLYAPRKLKESLNYDTVRGVYIPFFTYDADTQTAYTAKRGDYYYTTQSKTVNGKVVTERVRHTRWRTVHGVYSFYFDDVLVNASKKVDNHLVKRIGGFDAKKLVNYQGEFLAGYFAERYSKSLKTGWDEGRETVDQDIYYGIQKQVGGDEFRLINRSTNYGEVKFKHILLPLYMASFPYRNKVYQFIVHGESGRVVSEYPKSVLKILMTILILLIGFGLFYYFFMR
ncbi:MAG: hypothetical protein JXR88_02355 [Clostridia bacterium]|nr:hypothetical protein [Clostridia bacterium]